MCAMDRTEKPASPIGPSPNVTISFFPNILCPGMVLKISFLKNPVSRVISFSEN